MPMGPPGAVQGGPGGGATLPRSPVAVLPCAKDTDTTTAGLERRVAELADQLADMKLRVAELERRLGRESAGRPGGAPSGKK
jgi:hypothetical protein